MRQIVSVSVMLWFASMLTACTSETEPELTTTSTPALVSSSTPTLTPRRTTSASPTIPFTPTETPFPTPTIPQATLAVLATLDAFVSQHPDLGEYYSWDCMLYPSCYTSGLGLSPNGLWAVFFAVTPEGNGGLKIARLDGIKQWEIYFSEISGISCPPCGDALVSIEHWSFDGRYLYVAPQQGGDGGYDFFWGNNTKLIRLDLETGQWVDTKMGRAYSFSVDDKYLVYRSESGVHVHTFKTGDEQVFAVSAKYQEYGRFIWSPDSKKVIFIATEGDLEMQQNGFAAFLIDLEKASTRTIFEDDMRFIYPVEWDEPNHIILESLFDGQQSYQLDLDKNEITPIKTP